MGLKERQREAEIARAGAISSVHLLDEASRPSTRSRPSLARTLILALFFGTVGALGAAALVEYLDRKVRTPAELEEGLGIDVVGSIPRHPRRQRGVLTRDEPTSTLAETYRSLRANIRFAASESPIRSLAITSALQGEGKTVTTLNLAVVMAQAGDRVVVVDADMRRPNTHNMLGLEREPGLVDVLRGEQDWRAVLHETDVPGLFAMAAGRQPSNPGALLDSDAFRALHESLKQEFDYVLFDVPPVLAVADASAFFRQLDAVYLLTRYGRYTIDVAQGAQDQVERLGANLQGAVLNAFDVRRAARRRYGYYGYHGYHGYYRKYAGV